MADPRITTVRPEAAIEGGRITLEGSGFVVDGRRKRLGQWSTVLVPAGSEVSISNASTEPLVLMLVAYGYPIAQFVIAPSPAAMVHRMY